MIRNSGDPMSLRHPVPTHLSFLLSLHSSWIFACFLSCPSLEFPSQEHVVPFSHVFLSCSYPFPMSPTLLFSSQIPSKCLSPMSVFFPLSRVLLPCLSFLLVSFSHVPYTFVFLSYPLKVSLSHVFPSLSCPSLMTPLKSPKSVLPPCPLEFCFPLASPKSVHLSYLFFLLSYFSRIP